MIFANLRDRLIAAGLGVALVALIGLNVKQAFIVRDLRTTVRTLDAQLNDPETGALARLATCRSNNLILSSSIDRQNASVAANAARGAAAVADATRAVADAQRETADAQRAAAAILSLRPAGESVCERVLDVDRRVLESVR